MLWPRPLPLGGTIGICSPAGPSDPGAIPKAVAALERRGFRVVVAPHAQAHHPRYAYLAGSVQQRVSDLNGLLQDPSIDLILAARGGYGSAQLLAQIDYEALRKDPKPVVGYSDITALNLAFAAQAEVVSFSGIMATAGDGFGEETLDPFSEQSFFYAVQSTGEPLVFQQPAEAPLRLHQGNATVSGRLIPVCLTLLESLASTRYVPDLTGAILVIEDVTEELYAVDRALTQLRLSGVLSRVSAVLIGSFNGWNDDRDEQLRTSLPPLVCEMVPEHVTVASGLLYGHVARRFTLPVGAHATADLEAGCLTVSKQP